MSAITRIAQIFSVFGVGASVPLTTVFAKDRLKRITFLRHAGGGNKQLVVNNDGTAMNEAFRRLSEGEVGEKKWGCFWIPGFPETELFFCFEQTQTNNLTMFHWKSRGRVLNEVENITKPTTVKFRLGGSQALARPLSLLLGWTQKWPHGTAFSPSTHCQISKNDQNGYKLTCTNPSPSETKNPAFERIISKSHIVEPGVSLKK